MLTAQFISVGFRSAKPGNVQTFIGKVLDGIFEDHRKNRIIIATFASNVDRVQQIINCAEKYGRKDVSK